MRSIILIVLFLTALRLESQTFTVNSADDKDDGVCDVIHCSLREAINAAQSTGNPSTIIFNIPGQGPHTITPNSYFPTITRSDLTIKGETQPGGPGSLIIDFQQKDFKGIPFWIIKGYRFYLSGIDFTNFLFSNAKDCMLYFGYNAVTYDCRINNCSFIRDTAFVNNIEGGLITVNFAQNLRISNCNFGTNNTHSFIKNLVKALSIGNTIGMNATIDSNLFINTGKMIEWWGGDLSIERNIFGVLDTLNKSQFINSDFGIWTYDLFANNATITNNYFFGLKKAITFIDPFTSLTSSFEISHNQFFNNENDILIFNNDTAINAFGDYQILNNIAKDGRVFLSTNNVYGLNLEKNEISNYDTIFSNHNNGGVQKNFIRLIKHIDNSLNCVKKEIIDLNPHTVPWHLIPLIKTVNRDQITGSGNPNDSIVVYSNNRVNCPNAICGGGSELGRTQADASGNWVLNVVYPNKSTISAFQFDSDPNKRPSMYSEFSECYQCPGTVHINYSQSLCPGESIIYRGKTFSASNPVDSLLIKGDNVSICDSIFLINLSVNPVSKSKLDIPICSNDTLKFGPVLIHQGHLMDSIALKSSTGCDSTIIINATLNGLGQYNHTICEDDTLKIGGAVFSKIKLYGLATIKGGSITGCDSIIDVRLSIDNSKFIELPNDTTVHKGSPIKINPSINFIPSSIKWSPSLYLNCDTCLYPVSMPDANITYFLTLTDEIGCKLNDQFTISVLVDKAEIYVPNAFSPNGDNINDIFEPIFKYRNSTMIKSFRIFDRWGNQIYERLDGAIGEIFGWDGTAKGEKMIPGVYIYTIQFVGDDNVPKLKTGDITLIK